MWQKANQISIVGGGGREVEIAGQMIDLILDVDGQKGEGKRDLF